MMKLFRRSQAPAPEIPAFVECRSWNGVAFHIRETADPSGLALCGYEPLDDRGGVSPAEAVERAKHQHEGWRYCSSCLQAFTA